MGLIGTLGGQAWSLRNRCDSLWFVTDYLLIEEEKSQIEKWRSLRWVHRDALNNAVAELIVRQAPPAPPALIVHPIWQERADRSSHTCFVLMPFTPIWANEVYDAIRTACLLKSISVTRADELRGPWIMRDIWVAIQKASVVVADVTGKNPNIFYELGITHTLGRKTILLAQDANDIPFDVVGMRKIIYDWTKPNSALSLQRQLTGHLDESPLSRR